MIIVSLKKLFGSDIPSVYYILLFIGFSIMAGMSLSSSFLPILANNLDPSEVLVGLVVSAWFFSRIFIEIPAGVISDRVGRRRLLIFGLALSFFGPVICSQAKHIYILIFGRALWGMGTALYFMSNTAILMDILPASSRGKAIGVFQGFEFIGSFIGAPIGAFLATLISYTDVFYVTSLFMLISFVAGYRSKNVRNLENGHQSEAKLNLKEILKSLQDVNIIVVCTCNLFRQFIRHGIYQAAIQLYLNQILGLSITDIGWVISMRVAGMVLFLFIAGTLSDRYGRKPVLITGYLISAIALYSFSRAHSFILLLFSGLLAGAGDAFGTTTLIALLTDISPSETRGVMVGLFRTFQDLGGFIGPIMFILVFSRFNPDTIFYLGMLFCFLSITLVTKITQ